MPEPDFQNENGIVKVLLYKDIYTEELENIGLKEKQIKAVLYVKQKMKNDIIPKSKDKKKDRYYELSK